MASLIRQSYKLALGLSLALVLTACKESTYGPPQQLPPVEDTTKRNDPSKAEAPGSAFAQSLAAPDIYLSSVTNPLPAANGSQAQYLFDNVVAPLGQILLSEATLTNLELLNSTDFIRYAQAFHGGIIQIARTEPGHKGLKEVLKSYERKLLASCKGTGNCKSLPYFAQDGQYAFVLMYLTRILESSPQDAWTYLGYSLEFDLDIGRRRDFAYVPQSSDFADWMLQTLKAKVGTLNSANTVEEREERRRVKTLGNQIAMSVEAMGDRLNVFLDEVDIWAADAPGDHTRAFIREAIWPVLIAKYTIEKNGQPTGRFSEYAERNLKKFEEEIVGPFRSSERPTWQRAFKTLALRDLSETDKNISFLVDQVYAQSMTVPEALGLLLKLSATNEQILTAAEIYVQLRFSYLSMRSQEELAKDLGDVSQYINIKQLQEQLAKADRMEREWFDFQNRLIGVKGLVESAMQQGNGMTQAQRTRLSEIVANMTINTKWHAIYPNMLPVMYYISKANLSDTLKVLWFSVTIDSNLIIDILFKGRMSSWFNFMNVTNDSTYLTTPELIIAFRNAVLTGVFPAFNIKTSDFLQEMTDRLLDRVITGLQISSKEINDKILTEYSDGSSRSWFKRTIAYCRGEEAPPEEIEFNELAQYLSPYHREIIGGTLRIENSELNPYDVVVDHPKDGLKQMASTADHVRTDDMYTLDVLEKMVSIYKTYLQEFNETDDGLAPVEAKLQLVRNQIRHFYGALHYVTFEFEDCHRILSKQAKDRIITVMDYEQIYLQRAYADLRRVAQNPALLEEVNATYRQTYPQLENIPSRDRILKVGDKFIFQYNKSDFMMRLYTYLLRGVNDVAGGTRPAISPTMRISIPKNLKNFNQGGRFDYRYLFKHDEVVPVEYAAEKTYEEFSKEILTFAFYTDAGSYEDAESTARRSTMTSFVSWGHYINNDRGFSTKGRISTLSTFVKLGEFEMYDFRKPGCTVGMSLELLNKSCVTKTKVTSKDLLEIQKGYVEYANIDDAWAKYLSDTGSPMIMGRDRLKDYAFSRVETRPQGLLDTFRFMMNEEGLGMGVILPGEMVGNQGPGEFQHQGYRTRARLYFIQVVASGGTLLNPEESLSGNIGELFQFYVDREFAPYIELRNMVAAENAAGRGIFPLRQSLYRDTYEVPIVTGQSIDPDNTISQFNEITDYHFYKPEQGAR